MSPHDVPEPIFFVQLETPSGLSRPPVVPVSDNRQIDWSRLLQGKDRRYAQENRVVAEFEAPLSSVGARGARIFAGDGAEVPYLSDQVSLGSLLSKGDERSVKHGLARKANRHVDPETLAFIAEQTLQEHATRLDHSADSRLAFITAYSVAVYKLIEANNLDRLCALYDENRLEGVLAATEELGHADRNYFRRDPVQARLSVLTAGWHAAAVLDRRADLESTLAAYEPLMEAVSKFRTTYTLNMSVGLLAFALAQSGRAGSAETARRLSLVHYVFQRGVAADDPTPTQFNELARSFEAAKLALELRQVVASGKAIHEKQMAQAAQICVRAASPLAISKVVELFQAGEPST